MTAPDKSKGRKPMTRRKRVKTVTQWQVCADAGQDIHIHVFKTEKRAREFAAKFPEPGILEGGIVYPKPPLVRRVTYCEGTKP